jgi:hypothetical protein
MIERSKLVFGWQTRDIAEAFGISKGHARRLARGGAFRGSSKGHYGNWYIPQEEVEPVRQERDQLA